MVRELQSMDMSLGFLVDKQGMTPLHVATIEGRVEVLREILNVNPQFLWILTKEGETALHLCTKANCFNVTSYLVENYDVGAILNLPDKDGITVFHVAAARKLIQKWWIDSSGIITAKEVPILTRRKKAEERKWATSQKREEEWLSQRFYTIVLVAVLIATVTFQALITPPGNNEKAKDTSNASQNSPMSNDPGYNWEKTFSNWNYHGFMLCDTVGLMSSLFIILLIMSVQPDKLQILMRVLKVIINQWCRFNSVVREVHHEAVEEGSINVEGHGGPPLDCCLPTSLHHPIFLFYVLAHFA
ncbi:hypothetical protein AMTRI_Chr05g67030 [Amborella trichopoda]